MASGYQCFGKKAADRAFRVSRPGGDRMSITDAAHTQGRFHGKVAIVTGGASGIGRAIVERFVNDGAAVTVFDINESAGKEVETRLREAGHDVTFQKVDVSDKKQCVEAVDKVAEGHEGKIHALVNCAAYFGAKGETVTVSVRVTKDWQLSYSRRTQSMKLSIDQNRYQSISIDNN